MSDDQNVDDVGYEFDEVDHAVVAITQQRMAKVLESRLLSAAERAVVLAIAKVLAELPDTPSDLNASFSLIRPRRKFGDHEIYHHWSVEVEGEEIRVGAGGHFYRPSTGGDSFTSFRWVAWPGYATECQDFSPSIQIVDDAKPFGAEIEEVDLGEPGYSVSVMLDGEDVGEDDDVDDDVGDDGCENIDLHRQCRHVIHYDLGWNPATLEQRTGRTDRIGSKALRERRLAAEQFQSRGKEPIESELSGLDIALPYLAGTYDERMFDRLRSRSQTFEILTGGDATADRESESSWLDPDDVGRSSDGTDYVPLPAEMLDELRVNLGVL